MSNRAVLRQDAGGGGDTHVLAMPADTALDSGRDVRLDLFRGLALWFIFVDHVPTNIVSWLTVRNYGFSDATEIFVFISGYTAVIAYGRMLERQGWLRAAARIYRRVWQLVFYLQMLNKPGC